MNTLPRTITNPLIGDTVTFLETSEETNGAYTLVEVTLAAGGGNGLHYHLDFDEEFEVIEGVLGVQCEKEILHLKHGQTAIAA
jgi:quercetin dioxygenase-like cupin family protein